MATVESPSSTLSLKHSIPHSGEDVVADFWEFFQSQKARGDDGKTRPLAVVPLGRSTLWQVCCTILAYRSQLKSELEAHPEYQRTGQLLGILEGVKCTRTVGRTQQSVTVSLGNLAKKLFGDMGRFDDIGRFTFDVNHRAGKDEDTPFYCAGAITDDAKIILVKADIPQLDSALNFYLRKTIENMLPKRMREFTWDASKSRWVFRQRSKGSFVDVELDATEAGWSEHKSDGSYTWKSSADYVELVQLLLDSLTELHPLDYGTLVSLQDQAIRAGELQREERLKALKASGDYKPKYDGEKKPKGTFKPKGGPVLRKEYRTEESRPQTQAPRLEKSGKAHAQNAKSRVKTEAKPRSMEQPANRFADQAVDNGVDSCDEDDAELAE